MNKFLPALLTLILLVPLTANAYLAEKYSQDFIGDEVFPDVEADHPNHLAISYLSSVGSIDGYPDGTYKPDDPVNRAEIMKLLVSSLTNDLDESEYKDCFPDVPEGWFAVYVCYGKTKGWVQGHPDGFFKPAEYVNRVEAIEMVVNSMFDAPRLTWPEMTELEKTLELPADADASQWYAEKLKFALVKDFLDLAHVEDNPDGSINYEPGGDMTRKEIAELLFRVSLFNQERDIYSDTMIEAQCFVVQNDDMNDEELDSGILAIFSDHVDSEENMDELHGKFEEDEVVQTHVDSEVLECIDEV